MISGGENSLAKKYTNFIYFTRYCLYKKDKCVNKSSPNAGSTR